VIRVSLTENPALVESFHRKITEKNIKKIP